MPVKVSAIDHLVINVSDVARSAQWYARILGMEIRVFDPGGGKPPRTSLVFGSQKINVRPRDADKVDWFTADHEAAGSDDLCFLTSNTPDEVVAHLKANGVSIGAHAAHCARFIVAIPMAASSRSRRMRKGLRRPERLPGSARSPAILAHPCALERSPGLQ